jgi:hypothetical protein
MIGSGKLIVSYPGQLLGLGPRTDVEQSLDHREWHEDAFPDSDGREVSPLRRRVRAAARNSEDPGDLIERGDARFRHGGLADVHFILRLDEHPVML